MAKVEILGVKIDTLGFAETVFLAEDFLGDGKKHLIVTPYAESIVIAQRDSEFRRLLNEADLAVPDGSSLLAAAKFLERISKLSRETGSRSAGKVQNSRLTWAALLWEGVKVGWALLFDRRYLDVIKEPVRGVDLIEALCERAAQKGRKVFLLGGWKGVGEKAAEILMKKYPGLQAEAFSGMADVERETEGERRKAVGRINEFAPDLLFVAYGPVRQEKWLARNLPRLRVRVAMGVGGAFDLIAGVKPRAPLPLRRCGLEWLWRFLLEPQRAGRIFRAVVVFPFLVFSDGLSRKLSKKEEISENPTF